MVELGDTNDDAMTNAHLFGLHRARGQENFGSGAMRIFFEEMMLDAPDRIETEFIGQNDLLEAIVKYPLFGLAIPWTRHRDLIEDSKFHACTSGTTVRMIIAPRTPRGHAATD